MDGVCRTVHDATLPVAPLAREIRRCGYAHIGPGLFPQAYVKKLQKHLRRWNGNTTNVYDSGAHGGRIHLVPPAKGPFGEGLPFTQPRRQLFEIMEQVLSPGICCHLFLLSVMLALNSTDDGDQRWHRDQIRAFGPAEPWVRGQWNHYYVYLFPHDVPASLGPIELMPRSQPYAQNDLSAHDPEALASSGRSMSERAASRFSASPLAYRAPFLQAGSVLIHEASLAHRGLKNRGDAVRYAVRYDLFAAGDARVLSLGSPAGSYYGQPAVAERTLGYTRAMYAALHGLRLPGSAKLISKQRAALSAPIVHYTALTAPRINTSPFYAHPVLWLVGTRAALKTRERVLKRAAAALEGRVHVVFLDVADPDAHEMLLQAGAWPALGGLQLVGSRLVGSEHVRYAPSPSLPWDASADATADALRQLADQLEAGRARRLARSGPPSFDTPNRLRGAHHVQLATLESVVTSASPVLLLLYSSDACCGVRGLWRCDPCEQLHPVYDELARRFHADEGGGGVETDDAEESGRRSTVLVAKMDMRSNDPPRAIRPARLPYLIVVYPTHLEHVPESLYADEEHTFRRLSEYLEGLPRTAACPAKAPAVTGDTAVC